MPSPSIRLAATLAPIAAVAAFAVPTTGAGAASFAVSEPQVCQYSYDQAWRAVPVTLSGTLVDIDGDEITPGQALVPGAAVRLQGATVSAALPGWIGPFAYDGGIIGNGTSSLPVHGWIALEATNTVEGTTAPIRIDTNAIAHADVQPGQAPTEDSVTFEPVTASIPDQTWTAAGGDVLVRQAVGTKMAPIPAGRDGSPVQVNGTLFVAAELDASTRLFLDCLAGGQLEQGGSHSDKLPDPLSAIGFRVPGFTGAVDGDPLVDPVDAQLENPGLFRAAAGQPATVTGTRLRLRLTAAQRTAWLGAAGSASVSGDVTIVGDRSTAGQQTVTVPATAVSAPGTGDVVIDLPATTWTATGATGVDLRGADTISLTATNGATRTLTLQRNPLRATSYPFAYVLGPDPRTKFEDPTPPGGGGVGTTNPPALDGPKAFAPPPVLTRRTTVKIATTRLKRSKGKVKIRLTNLSKTATTAGKFRLVTTSKYRVGKSKKKRAITLVGSKSFSLKKGRSVTYTVKLSKDATALLKTRKSVKAKLTVTPKSTKTQKTVTKTLTVKR
jgi:hypothetical protein